MTQDSLLRAYARLNSLKNNLPDRRTVHEKYVAEYHAILDAIEKEVSTDLAEFRIPEAELQLIPVSGSYVTGRVDYSESHYCERTFMLSKLEAILAYFTMLAQKDKIGFKPPRN